MTTPLRWGFLARHLIASLFTVLTVCAVWTTFYFSLFIGSMFFGGGLGSPATYPVGLFVFGLGAAAACLTLFLPSSAFGEWIARQNGLPMLAQIPISTITLAMLCVFGSAASGMRFSMNTGILFLTLLLLFGLYWWIAQSGPIVRSVFRRIGSLLDD